MKTVLVDISVHGDVSEGAAALLANILAIGIDDAKDIIEKMPLYGTCSPIPMRLTLEQYALLDIKQIANSDGYVFALSNPRIEEPVKVLDLTIYQK